MTTTVWRGIVTTGLGRCSQHDIFPPAYVPGSLNLLPAPGEKPLLGRVDDDRYGPWVECQWMPVIACDCAAIVDGAGRAAIVHVGLGNGDIAELVSMRHLRTHLDVDDGDEVQLVIPGGIRP